MRHPFWPVCFLCLALIQCTGTRWTVTDLHSVNPREAPRIVESDQIVVVADSITPENPFLSLRLLEVRDLEYNQRIRVERTMQRYQPRWGFAAMSLMGASLAFYAGNTDGLITSPSGARSLALNSTGLFLTALAFTHLRTVDEPIYTGEIRHLRRSGTMIRQDSVATRSESAAVQVVIRDREGAERLNEQFDRFGEEGIRIDLSGLARGGIEAPDPGEFTVLISQNDRTQEMKVPGSDFLRPFIRIGQSAAGLRPAPRFDEQPPLVEVATGSELPLEEQVSERWYKVRFGGTQLFLPMEAGEMVWRSTGVQDDPTIITLEEVPFGEIDVEYAVPLLRLRDEKTYGVIASNHLHNQIGSRRYLERDYRLMELYFGQALGAGTVKTLHISPGEEFRLDLPGAGGQYECSEEGLRVGMGDLQVSQGDLRVGEGDLHVGEGDSTTPSTSTLYLYLGGFGRVVQSGEELSVELIHVDEQERVSSIPLEQILEELEGLQLERLVVFVDLEFQHRFAGVQEREWNGRERDLFRQISSPLLARPDRETAVIFSSRPDQSSGLYERNRFSNQYHHLFPYFLAQGLQQRRTRLSDLVRHIENQVDYTSRRLHDRPQTVQAFGDLSIDLGFPFDAGAGGGTGD